MVEITATYSLEYSLSIFLWKRLKSPKHGTINIPTILNSLIVILAREEKEKKKKKELFLAASGFSKRHNCFNVILSDWP